MCDRIGVSGQRVEYLAHSANDDGAGVTEPLRAHLQAVADRAADFAAAFGADEQARAAGLLHDLGKYSGQFLRRLADPGEPSRDHWSAGACLLAARLGKLGLIPALAVAGHHGGLDELPGSAGDGARAWANAIAKRMKQDPGTFTETGISVLHERYLSDGLPKPMIGSGLGVNSQPAAAMIDVRMVYSALVDADFLETEAHFNGNAKMPRRPRPDGPVLHADKGVAAVDAYLKRIRGRFRNSPMAAARETLLRHCTSAALQPPGLFSLSAPTGGAKTLAMLTFALHHAREHGLRRIVLVMPFLNIIEQTADIYRSVFSPENGFDDHTVLEHHSLVEYDEQNADAQHDDYAAALPRLLAENWDAPVILTTSVQFLESLMAARPSRCRKLHRLARSVILFDEVQTLPVKLAVATLATLSRLAEPGGPYRSTVLFATATQPEFEALDQRVCEFAGSGWRPVEIVPDPQPLYAPAARRVCVAWRHQQPMDLEQLGGELLQLDQVLCIVNLKRHASRLAAMVAEEDRGGVLHLSTNMCPAHRTAALAEANKRLQAGLPVRLVATQCVEAGVDLDFPVVYRALGPLEAIAQAAGRCNRHGSGERGQVVVFKPEDERGIYPPGYKEAVQATESFLAALAQREDLDATEILNDPATLRAYFRHLYGLSGRTSTNSDRDDERPLLDAIRAGSFREVSELYRLIQQDSINVLVPYDTEAFNALEAEIVEARRLTPQVIRSWVRRVTPHAVSMTRPKADATVWNHLNPVQFSRRREVDNDEATWFVTLAGLEYDPLTGISGKNSESFWIT